MTPTQLLAAHERKDLLTGPFFQFDQLVTTPDALVRLERSAAEAVRHQGPSERGRIAGLASRLHGVSEEGLAAFDLVDVVEVDTKNRT